MEHIKEGIEFFEEVISDAHSSELEKYKFIKMHLNKLNLKRIGLFNSEKAKEINDYISRVYKTKDYQEGTQLFMQIYKNLKDIEFDHNTSKLFDVVEHQSHFSQYENLEREYSIHHKKYLKERKKCSEEDSVELAEHSILNPNRIDSENLHKFEINLKGYPIFRSGIGQDGNNKNKVLVYTLLKHKESYVAVFLRCLKHKRWIELLDSRLKRKLLVNQIEGIKADFKLTS